MLSHEAMATAVSSAVDSALVKDEWKSIPLNIANNGLWLLEIQILCTLLRGEDMSTAPREHLLQDITEALICSERLWNVIRMIFWISFQLCWKKSFASAGKCSKFTLKLEWFTKKKPVCNRLVKGASLHIMLNYPQALKSWKQDVIKYQEQYMKQFLFKYICKYLKLIFQPMYCYLFCALLMTAGLFCDQYMVHLFHVIRGSLSCNSFSPIFPCSRRYLLTDQFLKNYCSF